MHVGRIDLRVIFGLLPFRPRLVLKQLPGRIVGTDPPQSMRRSPRKVAEKGRITDPTNKLHRLVEDFILRMSLSLVETDAIIPGKENFLTVPDQVAWIKGMRVNLIVVSKKSVEAVFLWHSRRSPAANSPLSKSTCRVSLLFEHARESRLFLSDG